MKPPTKIIVRLAAVAAGLYLSLLVGLTWKQRALLYHPSHEARSPAALGFAKAQTLSVVTADGETLVAWYVPPAAGKPLLLYFHGNGGGLADRVGRFERMTSDGHGLLAIAYRSYFGSTGSPSEEGLHLDADAAYAKAIALGASPDKIIAVGESLGSGVAIALATRKPVAALVLDSPYASVVSVAAETYWMVPVHWLLQDQFRSDQRIGSLHVPVLMAHGTKDHIIPLHSAKELFALANQPKEFIEVGGAGHLVLGRPDVWMKVSAWLNAHVER